MLTDFQALSLQGTLAFARLTIALLFIANLAVWWTGTQQELSMAGLCSAILCAAAAYCSQSCATHGLVKMALALQVGALIAALWAFWSLLALAS
jgi:hypothetical protein